MEALEILKLIFDTLKFYGTIIVMILVFFCLGRAIVGPGAPDRVTAINIIGTKTVVIIALLSLIYGYDYYTDIAMVYALMAFIATIGVAKYMEKGALE